MKSTCEAHGQLGPAQCPLEKTHQIQMAEQRHRSGFAEAKANATDTVTRWRLLRPGHRNCRWRHHNVMAQIRAADATTAAGLKRAVGHNA